MNELEKRRRKGRGEAGKSNDLAAALRANLKRRKEQARAREADSTDKDDLPPAAKEG